MTKSDKYFKELKDNEYFLSDMDIQTIKSDSEQIKKMDISQVQAGLEKMRGMILDGSIAPNKKNGAVEVMKLLTERAGQLETKTKLSPEAVIEKAKRDRELADDTNEPAYQTAGNDVDDD